MTLASQSQFTDSQGVACHAHVGDNYDVERHWFPLYAPPDHIAVTAPALA